MEQATLIAGCGYIGTELGMILAGSGGDVYGLRRDPSALPVPIHPVAADLGAPLDLPDVPDLGALVYCASAGERTRDAYRRAYIDGVSNLRDALGSRAERLERAVFVSSTAVYGDGVGDAETVDDATPPMPKTFTGELLLEGEARFASLFPNAIVVRLAGIYGPGRTRVVRQVATGGPFETAAEAIGNRIHRDDCAGAIAHLLSVNGASGVYVGVDDAPVPLGEVRAFVAARLGLDAGALAPRGPSTGKRMKATRLAESGYRMRVPSYREGYPSIIDGYLARPAP